MSLETITQTISPPIHSVTDNVIELKSVSDRSVRALQSAVKKPANRYDDVDDMWDNVPV